MIANGTGQPPRILTVPAGLPFLRTLAASLLDGTLTPHYRYDRADPLALSRITILVPTRRSTRMLRAEFARLLGGEAAILPIIKPLGETEEDGDFFDADAPELLDLAPPISNVVRLLELARLILAWRNKLPDIVRSIHSDSPLVAPASPSDAVWLARALVELIDAVETEELEWDALDRIDARDHAGWWQLTLAFLHIAIAFWPERLKELSRSSPSRHRNESMRAEIRRFRQKQSPDPVIVAGSTGAIPAAADFIHAVAEHPTGTVVLPGLDLHLSQAQWAEVDPVPLPGKFADAASRSHPQYNMSRLLKRLKLEREDITEIEGEPEVIRDRAMILSQAMAPAASTDRWSEWRAAFGTGRMERAFADVALLEAGNEREEAAAIAIALRLALEEPGADGESRAALITPDRALARRVAAELARYGILADDSAGTPFVATPQGTLIKLLLEATLRPGDPLAIVSLLKHPLCRFGFEVDEYRKAVWALEILALRGGVRSADISDLGPLLEHHLAREAETRRQPQWRTALDEDDIECARLLAERIRVCVEPLTSALARRDGHASMIRAARPLSDWATRAGRVLEAITTDPERGLALLWDAEGGASLAQLLGEVIETDGEIEADGPQFIDIMDALMAGAAVKPQAQRNPRVFIFGTLESRLQNVDTVIIGGMNEGSWPVQSANNPFLSRHMKSEIGLEPPERRIGQQAHDLAMASGTAKLIYSRALKQGGAPTVASRWIQRLLALGGTDFAAGLRERGNRYLSFAQKIDIGASQAPAQRPDPRPPLALQPKSYSFSEVGRLRRDPYAIYARRVLRLDPLLPFNADPGAAERGSLYHAIVDRFVREGHDPLSPEAAPALSAIATRLFDEAALPLHIDIVWRVRFAEVARSFLAWERRRKPEIRASKTEIWAALDLPELGIALTGIADRIDLKPAGHADIIDYKTGSSPSLSQARSLLDPQLPLEAAALSRGAFTAIGAARPADLLYVRLRPGTRFSDETVNNELSDRARNPRSAVDLAEEALDQLAKLVTLLQTNQRGFVSRLIPEQLNDFSGEYDHLARVAEWSTAEASEGAADE